METKGRKDVSGLFSPLSCPSSWYWMPLSSVQLTFKQGSSVPNDEASLIIFYFMLNALLLQINFSLCLKTHIPNIFIFCSKKINHVFGQLACAKHSFSNFIVPHRLTSLKSL